MKKALLTSAGFETTVIIVAILSLLGKAPREAKVLFVPTAAISPDAVAVLPACMDDLLKIGVLPQNIRVFDLHRALNIVELSVYDAIYFTGGDPSYLIQRINDTGFDVPLKEYASNIGIYIGVSAGSLVATNDVPDGLGLLNCRLSVHSHHNDPVGIIDETTNPHIRLSDSGAIVMANGVSRIIE